MATVTEVRNAIKDVLKAAFPAGGLTAYAIEPASPNFPAAWSLPMRIDYHASTDGALTYRMAVNVGTFIGEIGHAQTNLDPFLAPSGAKSIVAILEADPSLGGVVDSLQVLGMTGYGVREVGGKTGLVATFEVEIYG
jgi:hypothetical protein